MNVANTTKIIANKILFHPGGENFENSSILSCAVYSTHCSPQFFGRICKCSQDIFLAHPGKIYIYCGAHRQQVWHSPQLSKALMNKLIYASFKQYCSSSWTKRNNASFAHNDECCSLLAEHSKLIIEVNCVPCRDSIASGSMQMQSTSQTVKCDCVCNLP